jgi:transposase
MTQMRGNISSKRLQRELGVTYKTAWRIHKKIRSCMEQNNGDLLHGAVEIDESYISGRAKDKVHKWVIFNKIEFKVIQKKEKSH